MLLPHARSIDYVLIGLTCSFSFFFLHMQHMNAVPLRSSVPTAVASPAGGFVTAPTTVAMEPTNCQKPAVRFFPSFLCQTFSAIHFAIRFEGRGCAGAYPACFRTVGGVHPELDASRSQGTHTRQTTIRAHTHLGGQFRVFR